MKRRNKGRRSSREMVQTLREQFDEIDADGSGYLDPGAIKAALQRRYPDATGADVQMLVQMADADGNGQNAAIWMHTHSHSWHTHARRCNH
eukprot:6917704-Prymnesium_polylepis.1